MNTNIFTYSLIHCWGLVHFCTWLRTRFPSHNKLITGMHWLQLPLLCVLSQKWSSKCQQKLISSTIINFQYWRKQRRQNTEYSTCWQCRHLWCY